jgi:hypothetical protein
MKLLQKIGDFVWATLKGQWLIIVGAICLAFLQMHLANSTSDHALNRQVALDAQVRAIESFEVAAAEFPALGALYFDYIDLNGEVSPEYRTAIIENISRQMSTIDRLERYSHDQTALSDYRNALISLRNSLSYNGDPASLRDFWQSANDILENKPRVLESLNTSS